MASEFPLYSLVANPNGELDQKFNDICSRGLIDVSEAAKTNCREFVSTLEPLYVAFRRELALFQRLIYVKNNQQKTAKYWHKTKQVNARLKSLNFPHLINIFKLLYPDNSHLKKKLFKPVPWDYALYKLLSTAWICSNVSEIIIKAYTLYSGMVELSHFLPIALSMMAILSRFYIICGRLNQACILLYNKIYPIYLDTIDKSPLVLSNDWKTSIGTLPELLTSFSSLSWQSSVNEPNGSESNLKELNKLRSSLEKMETDDLGEPIDLQDLNELESEDDEQLPAHLLYVPPKIKTPQKTSKDNTKKVDDGSRSAISSKENKKIEHKKIESIIPKQKIKSDDPVEKQEHIKKKEKSKKESSPVVKSVPKNKIQTDSFFADVFDHPALSIGLQKDQQRSSQSKIQEVPKSSEKKRKSSDKEIDDIFDMFGPKSKKKKV